MRRRESIAALGALAVAPLAALGQTRAGIFRIGGINPTTSAQAQPYLVEFRRGLQELGHTEGKDFALEERYAEGRNERLYELAVDLVRSNVDLILASTTNAASAAQKATAAIPIVFVAVSDPVASGFALSLARPGRNMTGLSNFAGDLAPKRLELLKSVAPHLSSVAFLVNPGNPLYPGLLTRLRSAADQVGLKLLPVNSAALEDIDAAFATMKRERVPAVVIGGDVYHFQQRAQMADAAIKHRIASISPFREYAEAGGLMSYGTNVAAQFRRIAKYVDKILKGAKPGDLPIEQPAVFEFVINLKTAKSLDIRIPDSVLVRADRVIE
jgi:putative ABC transport system substrate-binding protein